MTKIKWLNTYKLPDIVHTKNSVTINLFYHEYVNIRPSSINIWPVIMSISLNCSIKSNTSGTFSDTECKFYTAYCVWFKAGSCNFKYSHRIYTKHPDNKNLDISLKKSLFNYFLLFFFFLWNPRLLPCTVPLTELDTHY